MKKLIILIAIALVVGGGYYYKNHIQDSDKTATKSSLKSIKGDIEDVVTATGSLQPRDYVEVGAQVSGQLHKLYVDIGDVVKKGDLLAEIDPELLSSKVDASRAQLKYQEASLIDKEAEFEYAKIILARQENLYKDSATSLENLQSAELSLKKATASLEMLKAQIEQTRSNLKTDETNLEYTKIYATMDGTVVSLSAKEGQTLNANQTTPVILKIADLRTMTVNTEVSEAEILKVKHGMEVYFKTMGSEKKWYTEVRKIEPTPTVTNNVVLYNAVFDIDNSTGELMSDMTAQVFFVANFVKDAIIVPISTIKLSADKKSGVVNVLKNGEVEQRKVEVGLVNRLQVQVLSGLSEGESLVQNSSVTQQPQISKTQQKLKR
ncbi:MAG: efflux RND transporter periplasmic adaptor subunit [Sulfurimonadaceae bacterium]|jgi:macrolide-specific efflux system membrane fusion protein|nr:efflux RND transporter periplasmic adaptor subunit [Sulfurimonadaceae bacterium]